MSAVHKLTALISQVLLDDGFRTLIPWRNFTCYFQGEYRVDEGDIPQMLNIKIYRGWDRTHENRVGPIDMPARVSYKFVAITATAGADYIATDGNISFSAGYKL